MRPILFAAVIIGAGSVLATDAMAQFYPRRAPVFGLRFFGPALYAPWFYRPRPVHVRTVRNKPGHTKPLSSKQVSTKQVSTKQVSTKQVSTKQVSTKQVSTKRVSTRQVSTRHGSTMRLAATTRDSARPSARTSIPLPDQELLTPPPEFDCAFKTTSVDDASDQSQPSPTRAQADPNLDVLARMKLDYERQCFRHAEIILRDRLRQLQAAVGETIEAVNRSEKLTAIIGISTGSASRPVIPLPDHALLTSQPEFDCAFKITSVDDVSDQPQPSPTRAQADPNLDVLARMKLDYERQCFRHAEIILRDRLRQLQAGVGETIKAAILGTIKTEVPQEAQ
jgi:hypothetical protein